MQKPNVKDKPKWANFMAQDEDGTWWWFENEPKRQYANSGFWSVKSGLFEEAKDTENPAWELTLEEIK